MEPMQEVSRQEFEMLTQQLMEMQGQLAAEQERNAELEQAVNSLVEGLQAEKDGASREDFFQSYQQEFAGDHDMSDRAWQMYEDSDKSTDQREFVSRLVSEMDNQMLKYLAAKGIKLMAEKSGETEPPEMSEEVPPAHQAEGETPEPEQGAEGEPAAGPTDDPGERAEQELSSREKINRLLTQND